MHIFSKKNMGCGLDVVHCDTYNMMQKIEVLPQVVNTTQQCQNLLKHTRVPKLFHYFI